MVVVHWASACDAQTALRPKTREANQLRTREPNSHSAKRQPAFRGQRFGYAISANAYGYHNHGVHGNKSDCGIDHFGHSADPLPMDLPSQKSFWGTILPAGCTHREGLSPSVETSRDTTLTRLPSIVYRRCRIRCVVALFGRLSRSRTRAATGSLATRGPGEVRRPEPPQ